MLENESMPRVVKTLSMSREALPPRSLPSVEQACCSVLSV